MDVLVWNKNHLILSYLITYSWSVQMWVIYRLIFTSIQTLVMYRLIFTYSWSVQILHICWIMNIFSWKRCCHLGDLDFITAWYNHCTHYNHHKIKHNAHFVYFQVMDRLWQMGKTLKETTTETTQNDIKEISKSRHSMNNSTWTYYRHLIHKFIVICHFVYFWTIVPH